MNYRLSHTTTYEYGGTVSLSHHMLRIQPRELPLQRCLRNELQIDPRPDVLCAHRDYFGNPMTFVTIGGSHRKLVVTSRSQVDITAPSPPAAPQTPAWEKARDMAPNGDHAAFLQTREFIFASPLIKKLPEFAAYAAPSFSPGRPLLEAVLDLTRRMHEDFKFDPDATSVATPLLEVLKTRRGVCQDFAQLEIACLRAMGISARYVSGYLETKPPPGKPRLAGADASHAWVSFHCPGTGWVDVDPTNNLLVSNRHVTVAWGRDYSDVSPIRGIIVGSGEHSMDVAVDVIPVPEQGSSDLLTNQPDEGAASL
ncbi:MAG: transglutaminase family protein [Verrucomicrobiota bacterium]|jgi:transglutaminase-like putative cysteine protease